MSDYDKSMLCERFININYLEQNYSFLTEKDKIPIYNKHVFPPFNCQMKDGM